MSQINVDTIAPATSGRAVGIATPLFILHKPSGNQSISNATTTVVTWGTADVDTHSVSDLANNRIVITEQTAGYWWFGCGLYYSARATRMILWIQKNGSSYATFEHTHASTGTVTYPTVFGSALIPVVEGDIINTATYHNYGSAINVTDGSTGTWFHGYRVST
jgi:hypothetical protein